MLARTVVVLVAAALWCAPPAGAQVRLGAGPLHGLAAADGAAYGVIDEAGGSARYEIVRSTGRGAGRSVGGFASGNPEWVGIAGRGDALAVAWGRPTSHGFEQEHRRAPTSPSGDFGSLGDFGLGTGPGRLVLGTDGTRALAYPDRLGNLVVGIASESGPPATTALTTTAPEERHSVRDAALLDGRRVVALDHGQTRSRTQLRLLGGADPAPTSPVVSVSGRRALEASMAVSDDGRQVAVAYVLAGRVTVARLSSGGGWARTRLAGSGHVGTPAVVRRGGRLQVVYARRAAGQRDLYVATLTGGRVSYRRLTATADLDDVSPFAAVGGGKAFVGWTRVERGRGGESAAYLDTL